MEGLKTRTLLLSIALLTGKGVIDLRLFDLVQNGRRFREVSDLLIPYFILT